MQRAEPLDQRAACEPQEPFRKNPSVPLFIVFVLLSLTAEWLVSPAALFTTIIDVVVVASMLSPAFLFGHFLLSRFQPRALPGRWVFLFSAALGSGSLSILLLTAGLLRFLQRTSLTALLVALALLGLLSLRSGRRIRNNPADSSSTVQPPPRSWSLLWLLAIPFFTLGLLSASNAPGMIWQEEGFGYDVLEYHLALPKEYVQRGGIAYMPHNVYANFPANMEMLYLCAMVLQNHPQESGTTANGIHLVFAVLTVAAAWAIGRDVSPQAGIVGGIVAASCTWLEYLSGLAYVENGMLFYGACALAAAFQAAKDTQKPLIWATLSGLCGGFSFGCKYTALPMIVLPVAISWFFQHCSWPRRLACSGLVTLFALLAVSPWLAKNWACTGNPVFPLANQWYRAFPQGWGPEETVQWDRSHSVAAKAGLPERVQATWSRIIADPQQRFGPVLLILGLVGLFARRRERLDYGMVILLVLQLSIWTFATHQFARFAVPMIIPLTILAARALPTTPSRLRSGVVVAFVICGAAWNLVFAVQRHSDESAPGIPPTVFTDGTVPGYEYLGLINNELPPQARLLMLGEARTFYVRPKADYFVAFNANPLFALIAQKAAPAEIMTWCSQNRYSHLLVNWSEFRRISRTYGFNPPITEEELTGTMTHLVSQGIKLIRSFPYPADPSARYVELYQFPPREEKP